MAVTFHIPGPLRPHSGGHGRVVLDVPGSTVDEALAVLWRAHPGLRDRVLDERGAVRPHVNVFVGEENIRFSGGLATGVPDGATVTIMPAVSGGRG